MIFRGTTLIARTELASYAIFTLITTMSVWIGCWPKDDFWEPAFWHFLSTSSLKYSLCALQNHKRLGTDFIPSQYWQHSQIALVPWPPDCILAISQQIQQLCYKTYLCGYSKLWFTINRFQSTFDKQFYLSLYVTSQISNYFQKKNLPLFWVKAAY